jgi:hypothetical protein
MEEKPKEPVKKMSSVASFQDKKAASIVGVRTIMGFYIGEEELDEDGNIIGLKNAVEMMYFPAQGGLALMSVYLGNITEFPEDCVTIEIANKSTLRSQYSKEITGIVSPLIN